MSGNIIYYWKAQYPISSGQGDMMVYCAIVAAPLDGCLLLELVEGNRPSITGHCLSRQSYLNSPKSGIQKSLPQNLSTSATDFLKRWLVLWGIMVAILFREHYENLHYYISWPLMHGHLGKWRILNLSRLECHLCRGGIPMWERKSNKNVSWVLMLID